MSKLIAFFMEGGIGFMSVLTILLIAIFFAAWKAPRWVKEIGIFALAFGFLGQLLGVFQVLSALRDFSAENAAEITTFTDLIPFHVLFAGLKVTMNCLIYGVIVFLVSVIVRVIQKPRL